LFSAFHDWRIARSRNSKVDIAVTAALMFCLLISAWSSQAKAATFQYSYAFSPSGDVVVSGTFNGTLNGNLITDFTDIYAFLNGEPFGNNGSLVPHHYIGAGLWEAGGGVASLDGTENAFAFADNSFPAWGSYFVSHTGYYWSAFIAPINSARSFGPSTWSIQEVRPPEQLPVSSTLWLLALAALGMPVVSLQKRLLSGLRRR
jgi:hypothetical protein